MPTTYSPTIAIRMPDTGELVDTWGTNDNYNMLMVEYEVSRAVVLDITSAGTGLTWADPLSTWTMSTATNHDAATPAGKHRCIYVSMTGTLTVDSTVRICGSSSVTAIDKFFYIKNDTTGGFSLNFANSTGGTPTTFGLKPGYGCLVQLVAVGSLVKVLTNSMYVSGVYLKSSTAEDLVVSGLSSFATSFPIGTRNIVFGQNASSTPQALHASALDNTLIGYNVGTTIGNGGINNTFLGNNILIAGSDTTPTNSVVIGKGAGRVVNNLTSSIVIGVGACDNAAAVSDSVIIGSGSLATGDTSKSVIIGSLSARIASSSVPDGNVIIGYNALENGTTGTNGISIGRQLTAAVLTGINNIRIGYDSLKACTSGASNTVIGPLSATLLTTGATNVGIGSNSLSGLTTGSNNIAIGNSSNAGTTGINNIGLGTSSLSVTTGNNNIGIGNSAKAGTTGSSNISIGNTIGGALIAESGCVFIGNNLNSYIPPSSNYLAIASNTSVPSLHGNIANGNYVVETSTNAGTMLHVKNTHATTTNTLLKIQSANTTSNVVNALEVITNGVSTFNILNKGTANSSELGYGERFVWGNPAVVPGVDRIGQLAFVNDVGWYGYAVGTLLNWSEYLAAVGGGASTLYAIGITSGSASVVANSNLANSDIIITSGSAWQLTSEVGGGVLGPFHRPTGVVSGSYTKVII